MNVIKPPWLFFIAVTVFFISLTPGSVSQMGYMGENLQACRQIIANLGEWATLQYASTRIAWPRHGVYELLLELPFLLIGRLFSPSSPEKAEAFLAFQPVLFSSLLCTLLFVWTRRITASLTWAYVLGLVAAVTTMIWPYAYIGLETSQSLFLMLTAFLAIEGKGKKSWLNVIFFSLVAGLTISIKSNGLFLGPAVAYLGYLYFQPELETGLRFSRAALRKPLVAALLVVVLYGFNYYIRTLSPVWQTVAVTEFVAVNSGSLLTILFNLISMFTSPNKGLFIFSPVLLLCIPGFRSAFKERPDITCFALLTVAGLAGGCAVLLFWGDETWGPRYLHSAVAPLLLLIAASRRNVPFHLKREIPLVVLALLGLWISFLGVFFHYGQMHKAATEARQSTLENLQSHPAWNHIRFNARLFGLWVGRELGRTEVSATWPPEPHWWFGRPLEAPEAKLADLYAYLIPQPLIFRSSTAVEDRSIEPATLLRICLWVGLALLIVTGYVSVRRKTPLPAETVEAEKASN